MSAYEKVAQIIEEKLLVGDLNKYLKAMDFNGISQGELDAALNRLQDEGRITFEDHFGRPDFGTIRKTALW